MFECKIPLTVSYYICIFFPFWGWHVGVLVLPCLSICLSCFHFQTTSLYLHEPGLRNFTCAQFVTWTCAWATFFPCDLWPLCSETTLEHGFQAVTLLFLNHISVPSQANILHACAAPEPVHIDVIYNINLWPLCSKLRLINRNWTALHITEPVCMYMYVLMLFCHLTFSAQWPLTYGGDIIFH